MTVMSLNRLREKMIKRIIEIENEHFIPIHREKKEFLESIFTRDILYLIYTKDLICIIELYSSYLKDLLNITYIYYCNTNNDNCK